MRCSGCNNSLAYRIHSGVYRNEKGEEVKYEVCDRCGSLSNADLCPDVSDVREPYFDTNLCDKQHKNGQWVNSRAHKAEILKRLGLREKRESTIPYIKDSKKRREWFKAHYADA